MPLNKYGPNPKSSYPIEGVERVCFIKNFITNPNIIVGDYTYYDDPENPEMFEQNVLYHYDFIGDKLIIGKFCAIASGVRFIMNGANHKLDIFTTYPFGVFRNGWEVALASTDNLHNKGDIIIGNDVWVGYNAKLMGGVQIGDGAIIAANSTVTGNVAPYTIVGGNPATLIRKRFDDDVIAILLEMKWWNWDVQKITKHITVLTNNDFKELKELL